MATLADYKELGRIVNRDWKSITGTELGETGADAQGLLRLGTLEPALRELQRFNNDESEDFLLGVHWAARWCQFGSPTFNLTHGLASALVLTDCGGLTYEDFHTPFPSWVVQLPQPLLTMVNKDGKPCPVEHIRFHAYLAVDSEVEAEKVVRDLSQRFDDPAKYISELESIHSKHKWLKKIYLSLVGGGTNLWNNSVWPEELASLEDWLLDGFDLGERGWLPQDRASFRAATRIIVNLCGYINAKRTDEDDSAKRAMPATFPSESKTPNQWVLDRSVKLPREIREAALEYCEGGERPALKIKSRFVVRGHWRRQAHGPNRSGRKLLWIEPHWKGPPDAVAAVERAYDVELKEQ